MNADSLTGRVPCAGFLEKVYERALLRELGLRGIRATANTVHLGKTGAATDFLLLEIGWLSQRFDA